MCGCVEVRVGGWQMLARKANIVPSYYLFPVMLPPTFHPSSEAAPEVLCYPSNDYPLLAFGAG